VSLSEGHLVLGPRGSGTISRREWGRVCRGERGRRLMGGVGSCGSRLGSRGLLRVGGFSGG
jgi:hypothetical protein